MLNSRYLEQLHPQKLSLDELVAQSVIFFVAGYDTTASTLSFATYLLAALKPRYSRQMREEVDAAWKKTMQVLVFLASKVNSVMKLYNE
ncbi:Cytochrome P450 3A31 like protein [Argiope bruennichi]|uniref:Cytochrome P450 3A31 like protein n=1 Tax=Argiope bruennichi TaxID=94029 RepID=A0A8T0G450_ARGBR|nr:Cytochrome P450 3A31 like protein [Argiope bruennichi]